LVNYNKQNSLGVNSKVRLLISITKLVSQVKEAFKGGLISKMFLIAELVALNIKELSLVANKTSLVANKAKVAEFGTGILGPGLGLLSLLNNTAKQLNINIIVKPKSNIPNAKIELSVRKIDLKAGVVKRTLLDSVNANKLFLALTKLSIKPLSGYKKA
jgi:hypothetical protein